MSVVGTRTNVRYLSDEQLRKELSLGIISLQCCSPKSKSLFRWIERLEREIERRKTGTVTETCNHRWVGNGEYGSTQYGYMCGDCGIDRDDTEPSVAVTETK